MHFCLLLKYPPRIGYLDTNTFNLQRARFTTRLNERKLVNKIKIYTRVNLFVHDMKFNPFVYICNFFSLIKIYKIYETFLV